MTSKATSKFAAILAAKNGAIADETNQEPSAHKKPVKSNPALKQGQNAAERSKAASNIAPLQMQSQAPRRVGRPNAKRSDPDFVQTTAYVKKTTHRDVKIALLVEGQEREYSELVESLLADWLKSKR